MAQPWLQTAADYLLSPELQRQSAETPLSYLRDCPDIALTSPEVGLALAPCARALGRASRSMNSMIRLATSLPVAASDTADAR